ncbi:MAG: HlyD family type I secretion periplasmic adaptor subunit [Proteobacteria bacterium]|nr:HlyD family type I secretion periplasmic adaptor subunit [Pseudomonadota bacterium]
MVNQTASHSSDLPVAAQQPQDTEAPLPTDTKRPARIGLWVLGLGLGGFLLWSSLAPLDEGVPTSGSVTIDTKRKTIQHLTGGIAAEIFVKEGEFVKAGAPLIRIDDASTQANFEAVRQHYLTFRAMEGRLVAEQTGQTRISFHPDLQKVASDPQVKQTLDTQQSLFRSRRSALAADQLAYEESIRGLEASIQGYQGLLASRKVQHDNIQEELSGVRDLVKEGYAPRNKQLELERMLADSTGAMADLQGNILRARQGIAEARARARQRQEEYRKEVDSQLADVRREVDADADKLKASTDELTRTTIRSPVEGQVVGLTTQTVGGIIGPGQKLMDIVPRHESLLLEAHVPPHLIDRLKSGQETDVRFSTFAHSPALVVEGKVVSISTDLITEPPSANAPASSYYLARIALTEKGLKELGDRQMQAGMPAEVVIKTGERTVLNYLLHPLIKRLAASMKEE